MIRYKRILAAAAIAVFLSIAGSAVAWSQARPMHSRVTPAEKQASNQLIAAAITQLQSAQGLLSGGNSTGASGEINIAFGDLRQALPIYHGYREKAMQDCRRALFQLAHPRRASLAPGSVSTAITNANLALQNAGDEVNERG